jgi:selenocysteine lyase/cysteine desulfurase
VFSFTVDGIHSNDIADYLADNDICIRAGQHCAEPLMDTDSISGSCRASLYIYNTSADIQKFFAVLDGCIKDLS